MSDQRGLSPEQALPAQEAPKPKPQDSGGGAAANQGAPDQMMQRQQDINRVNREQVNEKSSGGAFGAHGGGDGIGSGEIDVTPLPSLLLGVSSSIAVMPSETDAGEKSFAPQGLVAGFYEGSGGVFAFLEKFAQTMDEAGQKDMDPAGPGGGKDGADGKEGGVEGKGGGGKGGGKASAATASSDVDEGYVSGSENAKPTQIAGQKRGREAPANANAPSEGKPSGYDSGYASEGPSPKRQATARPAQAAMAVNSAMPEEAADFGASRKYTTSNNNATSGGGHGSGSQPPANASAHMYTANANNPPNPFATLPRTNAIQAQEPFEVAGLGHLTPSPTPSVGVSRDRGQSYGRG
ncbi:MAG: hypothetical protein ABW189_01170 [Rickettsiales bacterium]